MTCSHLHEQLWDFLYGLLDDQEAQPLRDHLADCPACQEELRIAQVQQKLLARAAFAIHDVPPFVLPDAETEVAPSPIPARLEMPPPAASPRGAARRWWPAWSAAAAVLLAALLGHHFYQEGLHQRQSVLMTALKDVDAANVQFATLENNLQRDLNLQAGDLKKQGVHLTVAGTSRPHPEAGNRYRVTTTNLDGQPQTVKLHAQLVDPKTKKVVFDHRQTIPGSGEVVLPDMLKDMPHTANLQVACTSSAGHAEVVEPLVKALPSFVNHIALNKTIFNINELAFFRTLTLDRFTNKPPVEPIALRFSLFNDQGKLVKELVGKTGAGGIAGGEFALTPDLATGSYKLQVSALDPGQTTLAPQTRRLEIVREIGPIVELDKSKLTSLRPGETANVPFKVRRQNGDYAANQAIIANVFTAPQTPGAAPVAVPMNGGYGSGGGFQGGNKNPGKSGQVQNNQMRLDNLGQGMVQFQVPPKIPGNSVYLQVELFEGEGPRKSYQTIPVVNGQVEVDFLPEGGDLIAGVPNHVYYRVRNSLGESVSPPGRVMLLSDTDVLLDAEPGLDSGSFTFVPNVKEQYCLRITSPEGVTEVANPFQKLGIKTSGVAMHLAQPVAPAGASLPVTLHNAGGKRHLLALATCRGQVVGQQTIALASQSATVEINLPPAAQGLIRVTIYEIFNGQLDPLAERLAFRLPEARLNLAVTQNYGQHSYVPGQNVQVGVKGTNEKGQPSAMWYLAMVADDRFQSEGRERPLGAHFHLASELKHPEDLDQANLALADTPASRQALDLFLGTRGWRRFVKSATNITTDMNKSAPVDSPWFFLRENNSLANLRAQAELRFQFAAAELRRNARDSQGELEDAKTVALGRVQQAQADLAEYQQGPSEWLRLSMGILALILVIAGVGLFLYGAFKTLTRVGDPTFAMGGAFACLVLCLILHLAGRSFTSLEGGRPPLAAANFDPPWVPNLGEVQLAWNDTVFHPVGHFRAVRREPNFHREPQGQGKITEKNNLPDKTDHDLPKLADGMNSQFFQYASSNWQNDLGKDSQKMNRELQDRFNQAKVEEETTRTKGKGSQDPSSTKKNPELFLNKAREYVHSRQGKYWDYQDTVLWHPSLFTPDGNDEVAFNLSQNQSTYRVLIFANTPDGRLGFYEGRLEVREAGKK